MERLPRAMDDVPGFLRAGNPRGHAGGSVLLRMVAAAVPVSEVVRQKSSEDMAQIGDKDPGEQQELGKDAAGKRTLESMVPRHREFTGFNGLGRGTMALTSLGSQRASVDRNHGNGEFKFEPTSRLELASKGNHSYVQGIRGLVIPKPEKKKRKRARGKSTVMSRMLGGASPGQA